jgi:RNA-directed DNA polymerase
MISWQEYSKRFKLYAIEQGFNEDYIYRCLTYAQSLYNKGLPIIYNQEHLSFLVGYQLDYLLSASIKTKKFYRIFSVPKKSGGLRQIAEPLPSLKEIQRWILDNILYQCTPDRFAKGFIPKMSIRHNARFHRNQKMVLSLDIKDFFASIKYGRVLNFYGTLGYSQSVRTLLAKLCTLDDALPQGAPTSPALSNLLSVRLDKRLASFALQNNLRYTRYADDITFSGKFNPGKVISLVRTVVATEGLELNEKKTRLMERHQRQEVTGVVVNEKLQAPRDKRRNLRQAIYYIKKYGINSHINHLGISNANYIKHLMGIANFFIFINPKDQEAKQALEILRQLLS